MQQRIQKSSQGVGFSVDTEIKQFVLRQYLRQGRSGPGFHQCLVETGKLGPIILYMIPYGTFISSPQLTLNQTLDQQGD